MVKNKVIFYLFWLGILSLAPITVLTVTPLSLVLKDSGTIVVALQRLFGLWVFTLMFVQIVLGAFMQRWTEKFGGWVFNFHVFQGILIYLFILVHTFSFVVFQYLIGRGFDPFFVYVDVCLLCGKLSDHAYNFGRLAFWSITVAVIAGYFRTANSFLRAHWRKLHILNYVAFILVGIHSLLLGSDVGTFPFSLIHAPSLIIVSGISLYKAYLFVKSERRS